MRIRVSFVKNPSLIEKLKGIAQSVEDETFGSRYEAVFLIDPGSFRAIDETLSSDTKGKGILEVLNLKETLEGEEKMK